MRTGDDGPADCLAVGRAGMMDEPGLSNLVKTAGPEPKAGTSRKYLCISCMIPQGVRQSSGFLDVSL